MRTNHVDSLLPDYVRGMLDTDESKIVEEHVQECPACREELAQVKLALVALEAAGRGEVPQSYFSSLVPRIHRRLDEGKRVAWNKNPVFSKLVVPLAAGILLSILVWHLPTSSVPTVEQNPLLAVVDSSTAEDLADIVRNNIPSQDLTAFNVMVFSNAMIDDQFVHREIVQEALASEITSSFNVFADVSPQQVLSDFDESQTNEMLQQLGHMETL